jgi:tol-pal system protein YbgF
MWATRAALLACLLAVGVNAPAASRAEVEARLDQLERKLDSRGLVDLMEQVKTMQRDLQELRGGIELQTHNLESLQKRQRDLYVDIDRRLHRLESGGAVEPINGAAGQDASGMTGPSGFAPVTSVQGSAAPELNSAAGAVAVAPAATLNPADERKDYDAALEILKQGRYNEASAAFQGFLQKYPGSSYADNAQYWLGEVFYVTRQFPQALAEFEKVPGNYPSSSKIADARLKIGYIQYEMKNWSEARQSLTQVVEGYPGTTTARLAQERLDRMKQEGN